MRRRGELGEGGECASSSAVSVCVLCVRVFVLGKGGRSVAVLLDVAERENREERHGMGAMGARERNRHGATSRVERQQFEC